MGYSQCYWKTKLPKLFDTLALRYRTKQGGSMASSSSAWRYGTPSDFGIGGWEDRYVDFHDCEESRLIPYLGKEIVTGNDEGRDS